MSLQFYQSYLVRWVHVQSECTISWSIQPHKKSIKFGIFKHPGSSVGSTPKQPLPAFEVQASPVIQPVDASQDLSTSQNTSSQAIEKLKALGWKLVSWHGVCEAGQVSSGKYDVSKEEGGMYALVFDNTFAKSYSKTATFWLSTVPLTAGRTSGNQIQYIQGGNNSNLSLKSAQRPNLEVGQRRSSESIGAAGSTPVETRTPSRGLEGVGGSAGSSFYTGILKKKRRRRGNQIWAARFFSLDFTTSNLSYYHDQRTLALRGTAPLSLAVIGYSDKTRRFSIDSGADIWHLKAPNQGAYTAWKEAFEQAKEVRIGISIPNGTQEGRQFKPLMNAEEEQDWAKVETLVGRVAGSRNALRRLAQDTDPKYALSSISTTGLGLASSIGLQRVPDPYSTEESPIEQPTADESLNVNERLAPWKRFTSSGRPTSKLFKRSVSAQPAIPSRKVGLPEFSAPAMPKIARLPTFPEESLHEHCMNILKDLDSIVAEFSTLLAETKQRRMPEPPLISSRLSMESQEFFDAEGGEGSQLIAIHVESDDEDDGTNQESVVLEADSRSDSDMDQVGQQIANIHDSSAFLYPAKAKSLSPLPLEPVSRRCMIRGPTVNPPTIWELAKAGMDVTGSSSLPVSANEPVSLLQRMAEQLEYSQLLDEASDPSLSSGERLLRVAAFSISSLSVLREKVRAHRKPFNPMLGETFELVREDRGFRFISEKVCHHPVILALQADSDRWSFAQTAKPAQKYWGKTFALTTDGLSRVTIHSTEDRFNFTTATCILNTLGEKYAEPKDTVTVINEVTGERAVITYKEKGLFSSGRSEELVVKLYDSSGVELPLG